MNLWGGWRHLCHSGGYHPARARVPLGRFPTPHDVAHLVAYLASDEASFITGQAYKLTGGRELT
jgi:NAD(P)-dependent dehydrogenase (short-subunit alcohol dehydrogenase family)